MREAPEDLQLDKRADSIGDAIAGDDENLLTTREVALMLGVSAQWLEIARANDYGPPYLRLGPRAVRYRRGELKEWLDERSSRHCAKSLGEVVS